MHTHKHTMNSLCICVLFCTLTAGLEIKMVELCDVLHIFLDSLPDSLRVTALVDWDVRSSFAFIKCFNRNDGRSCPLSVAPIDEKYFPGNSLDQHHEMIAIDFGQNQSAIKRLLHQKSRQMEMRYKWIFVNTKTSESIIKYLLNVLRDKPILPLSDIFYISKKAQDQYVYGKIYRPMMNASLIDEPYGILSGGHFIKAFPLLSGLEQRRNLQGKHFKGLAVLHDSSLLATFQNYSKPTPDTYTKTTLWFYKEFMQYANATLSVAIENRFGSIDPKTGKWTHLFGALQNHSVDFCMFSILLFERRIYILQYMVSTHMSDAAFIFRRPALASTDNVFLFPFDRLVWLCTALLIVVLFLVLVGLIFVEKKCMPNVPSIPASISDAFMVVFGASCQQGTHVNLRSFTSRLVMLSTFIPLMFLFVSYSAYIIVLLQAPSDKIQTLQNLYDSRIVLSIHNNSYNVNLFRIQTEPLNKAIYKNKILKSDGSMNTFSTEEAVRRVRDGSIAVHMEQSVAIREMAQTFEEYEKCTLKCIQFVKKPTPHIAMAKNSSYYEVVRVGMLRVLEHGLHSRHSRRIYPPLPDCTDQMAIFTSASFIDTMPAFLILAWGFLITLAILLLEIILSRNRGCIRWPVPPQ